MQALKHPIDDVPDVSGDPDSPDMTFEQALAPLRAPRALAASLLVSPRLVQAWSDLLVMHWSRMERLGGLDLGQPLYVLDFAAADASLAGAMLPALECALQARGMLGWPLRYVLCPPPGAAALAETWLRQAELQAYVRRGWLDRASWQARTGHPLLLGTNRFPLFGTRNPLVALCAGALSNLPMQLHGTHFGQLMKAHTAMRPPEQATQPHRLDYVWQAVDHAPARRGGGADLLEHYRVGVVSAPVLLSEASLALVDALADFSAGCYLLLACDRGVADEQHIRHGALTPPHEGTPGQLQLPVNFHALAWHQQRTGARVANLECGDFDAVVHLACRDDRVGLDDASWQGLLACADRGHPADRWWACATTPCHALAQLNFELRRSDYDPWQLTTLLAHAQALRPEVFASASEATLNALRLSLALCWRHLPRTQCSDALRIALVGLLFHLSDWPLARRVLQDRADLPDGDPALELQRAQLALATGAMPQARAHLARYRACCPEDQAARDLEASLERRQQRQRASRWQTEDDLAQGELGLELLDEFHLDAWLRQVRDPHTAQLAGLPALGSWREAQAYLDAVSNGDRAEFAVMHRDAGLVGSVGLHALEDMAHIHFWIGSEHQGHGLGTRCAALLCDCLRRHGVAHVFTSVYRGNVRSQRVLARAGFVPIDHDGQGDDAVYLFMHLASRAGAPKLAADELARRLGRMCEAIGEPLLGPA